MKAANHNLITSLMKNSIDGGIIGLQYADDTILFSENDLDKARHFKWLLACFKNLYGMKINYEKSDVMAIGLSEECKQYTRHFYCKLGTFPFKYMGIPLHYAKLRRKDIQSVIDKIVKRIAGWKGKLLSYGGRLTLLKACLSSIPVYTMYVIKFPKWALQATNSQMPHFFWNN